MFCLACRVFLFYFNLILLYKIMSNIHKSRENKDIFLHNNNTVIIPFRINNSLVLSHTQCMFRFFAVVSKMSFTMGLFKSGSNKV